MLITFSGFVWVFFTFDELLHDHNKTFKNCTRKPYKHLIIWWAAEENALCSASVTELEKHHDFIFSNLTATCSIFLKPYIQSTCSGTSVDTATEMERHISNRVISQQVGSVQYCPSSSGSKGGDLMMHWCYSEVTTAYHQD